MINERLKKIRETLKLSQNDFAKRLNLQRNSISLFENGKRNLSDRTILNICKEFNINEEWLREGKGEMFSPDEKNIVKNLVEMYNLDNTVRAIIEVLITLEPSQVQVITEYIKKVSEKYKEYEQETYQTQDVYNTHEVYNVQEIHQTQNMYKTQEEIEIEKEVEAYRLELMAEKKGKISQVSDGIKKKKA